VPAQGGSFCHPRGEEDLGVAVTVYIHDRRLGSETVRSTAVDIHRPGSVLASVEPESVHIAGKIGVDDLQLTVTVEISHCRVGDGAFDLRPIQAQRKAHVHRHRGPVVTAPGKASPISLEDIDSVVLGGLAAGAVVGSPCGHHLETAVAVHVGHRGRAGGIVCSVALGPNTVAQSPALQLGRIALPHPHLSPVLASVDRIGGDVAAVRLVGTDVVHVGRNDHIGRAVTGEVGDGRGVVENTVGVTSAVVELRPAAADAAGVLEHPGVDVAIRCSGDQDLQGSVVVEV